MTAGSVTIAPITIASNQGNVGGGEIMLLALAEAARSLGREVTIVAPADPGRLLDMARAKGFTTVAIPGNGPASYLRNLRRWDASEREGLLWCNGLRPAFATSGHHDRIVHLHQLPGTPMRPLAKLAEIGSVRTIVPSHYLSESIPGSTVLWNWTANGNGTGGEITRVMPRQGPVTIGYLGRLSQGKGVPVLCEAVSRLIGEGRDVRLLLAGESRFVNDGEAQAVVRSMSLLGSAAQERGWMDRDEFFASVDLAVFPSSLPESFGLVAAEAMAARCPFVVSDVGALPEVVGSDYPYLVRPDDAEALAERIGQALDADWAAQLEASHERWATQFTEEVGRERLRVLLDEIDATGVRA